MSTQRGSRRSVHSPDICQLEVETEKKQVKKAERVPRTIGYSGHLDILLWIWDLGLVLAD